MAMIRYPGSKEKLAGEIWERFPDAFKYELWSARDCREYREPFFGAGAIGFRTLRRLSFNCRIWINDIDPGIAALWETVRNNHASLRKKVRDFKPDAASFFTFKEEDGRDDLPVAEMGFRKLALHRLSFSGLGAMAGGPIGGKEQDNKIYDIRCRWKPEAILKNISRLHTILGGYRDCLITCLDFSTLIADAPEECFIYVDPPYYEKGPELYKHSMTEADHARLAQLLMDTKASWVLSYDDHEEVRRLYSWALIEEVGGGCSYTIATSKKARPKNREIIITPHGRDGKK